MSSLLGINFGSHRQAFFQCRITIHELNNVPMVAGDFKAKWRIDHTQNLPSTVLAVTAGPSTSATTDEGGSGHKQQLLHHKKSTSTLASQATTNGAEDNGGGSVDSGSLRISRDDASSTHSNSKRKSGTPKFLTGLREAFNGGHGSGGGAGSEKRSSPPSTSGRASIDDSRSAAGGSTAGGHQEENEHHHSSSVGGLISHAKAASSSSTAENPYEPRGETQVAQVSDNRVVWDRQVNVGVRIGVDKARVPSGGSDTSGAPRRSSSYKAGADPYHLNGEHERNAGASGTSTPRDGSASASTSAHAWGQLGQSELRISFKADVPTGIHESAQSKTTVRMGNIAVNLAEFAPLPHHHHHHHRKMRKQSQQHLHQQSNEHAHAHVHHTHPLSRTETRRYLLQEGPTNATIKLTVEMTHVGGSKEYLVPANKRGLLVYSSLTDPSSHATGGGRATHSAAAPSHSSTKSASVGSPTSDDDHSASSSGGGDHHSAQHATGGGVTPSSSSTAAYANSIDTKSSQHNVDPAAKVFKDWHPHSIARHTRIPDGNLNTTLSHKDTARAVKEAGVGGRLAFSFAAGAHHDRPPEDVIEALFSGKDVLLTPTPSRTEGGEACSSKKKKKQDQAQQQQSSSAAPLPPPLPPPPSSSLKGSKHASVPRTLSFSIDGPSPALQHERTPKARDMVR